MPLTSDVGAPNTVFMTSASPPSLTDRAALTQNRARARRAPCEFLLKEAAAEIQERLAEVNRTFMSPAIVTGFPDFWAREMPDAKLVLDSAVLDLEPGAHDLVIHALALHWADDPLGQIIQCRRALRPDGLFVGVLFGGESLSELRAVLAQAEADVTGGMAPRVVPMGEIRDLGALLQRAGLALPVADGDRRTVLYRDLWHLVHELRAMGESNALANRHHMPMPRNVVRRAVELYAQNFATSEGRLVASVEMLYLTGWAPSEDQQKPLRPGSAAMRLADALGVDETTFPDTLPAKAKR